MSKIRVHELAKEFGVQSKEVIAFLQSKGIEAKAESPHCGLDVPGNPALLSAIPADARGRGI